MQRTPELDAATLAQVVGGTNAGLGQDGDDLIRGDPDPRVIVTGAGDDHVIGGDAHDVIITGAGNDQVEGAAGDDHIRLGQGFDFAQGDDGADDIDGGDGADQLYGGAGDDTLQGGAGDGAADYAQGDAGNDTFVWAPGGGDDRFHGGEGQDTIRLHGVTMDALKAGLDLWNPGLTLDRDATGALIFLDAAGQPVSVSGTLTLGGQTLSFEGVERFALAG